jgi:hypothetical protein
MLAMPEAAGCPAELRDLLAGCLALDPAARPTFEQVQGALEHMLGVAQRVAGPGAW